MSLYDIWCHNHPGHVMVYKEDGAKGPGYYCINCEAVELDEKILLEEEMLADQLKRRIVR